MRQCTVNGRAITTPTLNPGVVSFIICLLMAATARGQVSITPPTCPLEVGRHYLLKVNGLTLADLPRAAVIAVPSATVKAHTTVGVDGEPQICFKSSVSGPCFVVIAVSPDGSEGPPEVAGIMLNVGPTAPPVPPIDDIGKQAVKWLDLVPVDAREEIVGNPITGEEMTRQVAVGKTFQVVGAAAEKLGSTKAMDSMLQRGLTSSYGDQAASWKPFAAEADKALAALVKAGVGVAEYGEALSAIGEALQK